MSGQAGGNQAQANEVRHDRITSELWSWPNGHNEATWSDAADDYTMPWGSDLFTPERKAALIINLLMLLRNTLIIQTNPGFRHTVGKDVTVPYSCCVHSSTNMLLMVKCAVG